MRKLVTLSTLALIVASMVVGLAPQGVGASSHREAPLIKDDPLADTTDVYAWVDENDPTKVNLVANYIPLEEPAGGPNYYLFGDNVRYEIKVDNNGDAQEDVVYRFKFTTTISDTGTFLYNTGPITFDGTQYVNLNVSQTYELARIEHGIGMTLGDGLLTPPVNIGPASTPDYETLAAAAVHSLPHNVKVFAGQRDDPFFVDLGAVFDLLTIRVPPGNMGGGVDGLGGFNVHTLALQVPITQLTACHCIPSGSGDPNAVIGVWSTASRPRHTVLNNDGTVTTYGQYVQVSRLGMPLVNEVVIPLGQKDRWNNSKPQDDGQFLTYVTDPELARLLNVLYAGVLDPIPETGRDDLVTVFLTGISGLNQPPNVVASEELRLNVAIPPCPASTCATYSRLGVIGGDNAGFPNGRRLADDVVDIEERAVACGYGFDFAPCVNNPSALNNLLGDGVDANDMPFLSSFPYVGTPHQGFDHQHHLVSLMGRNLPEQ